jgi:putative tricarboxylic transport membrane protein
MFDQLIAGLFGIFIGFLAGLLPGISLTISMIVTFPVLIEFSILQCLIFYVCLASSAQFAGSVTAMISGVPGENNTFPLLSIRNQLIESGKQSHALFMCAVSGVFGSIIVFIFSWLIIDLLAKHTAYLRVYVLIIASFIGILLTTLLSKNKIWVSVLMIISAWILSRIGVDARNGQEFLTFNNLYLSSGIPLIAVITGVYALPKILESMHTKIDMTVSISTTIKFKEKLELIKNNWLSGVRGSIIGFFSGLIPYIGIDLSSYLAFNVEKFFNKNNHVAQLTSSETAQNGAIIGVLLPLLMFGVAITASENILLEIIGPGSAILNWSVVKPWFHYIAFWLFVTSIISFLLSWNFALQIMKVVTKLGSYAPILFAIICVLAVAYVGMQFSLTTYYIFVLGIFGTIGYILRKYDFLPFILIFLLQDKLEAAIVRMYLIYLT